MSMGKTMAFAALAAAVLGTTLAAAAEPRKIGDEERAKITAAAPEKAPAAPKKVRKVLVFYRTEGFYHGVIPLANEAMRILGEKSGAFETEFSSEMSAFTTDNLARFDGVIFNNTTALKFDDPANREALLTFVKGGKGVIGIHAATDNFYNWPEAAEMMGGLFWGHPWGGGGTWAIKVDEPQHPLCLPFDGKGFWAHDELYRFKDPYSREKLRVLLSLDMSKEANRKPGGARDDNDHAVSWIHTVGDGRVFYCSLGHNDEIFYTPAILGHYLAGIQWALGDLEADSTPSAQLPAQPQPALAPDQAAP